jgi:CheY-like chemotaxis protein
MNKLRPILLVEDNLNDLELTQAALKQNNVLNEIVVARHGGEALDYLHRKGPHQNRPAEAQPVVVFLDLKMPKVDGLEVLRQMKSDEILKAIPVVMLTSSREEADLVKSYKMGVNAYVVKPVGFEQFTGAIRQLGMFWAVLNEPPPESACK